jgi:hypothetical protein
MEITPDTERGGGIDQETQAEAIKHFMDLKSKYAGQREAYESEWKEAWNFYYNKDISKIFAGFSNIQVQSLFYSI